MRRYHSSHNTSQSILSYLPPLLELCNEHVVHNKVHAMRADTVSAGVAPTPTPTPTLAYNFRAAPPVFMRVIPRGRKAILWLRKTPHGQESVVIMKHIDKFKKNDGSYFTKFVASNDIHHYTACFNPILCAGKYGTILYGTVVSCLAGNVQTIFSVEDILCFQGLVISPAMASWNDRIRLISVVLQNTRSVGYFKDAGIIDRSGMDDKDMRYGGAGGAGGAGGGDTSPKDIVIMSPITVGITIEETTRARISKAMEVAYKTLDSQMSDLPYTCFAIQLLRGDDYGEIYSNTITSRTEGGVAQGMGTRAGTGAGAGQEVGTAAGTGTSHSTKFYIKADTREDIYYLYETAECDKVAGTANICDYKTSVMMNSIFRNIKENRNLDALEESDDEDEFEDTREDRFVDVKKRVLMICEYSPRFRSWVPRRVVETR